MGLGNLELGWLLHKFDPSSLGELFYCGEDNARSASGGLGHSLHCLVCVRHAESVSMAETSFNFVRLSYPLRNVEGVALPWACRGGAVQHFPH